MQLKTVDNQTVLSLVGMSDAIEAVRSAFIDFELGEFEMATRLSLGESQFLVMPAYHRPTGSAVVKSLSLNFNRNPPISGTVTWVELSSTDNLVIEAEAVTALRTGAAAGVATDLLAPADASRLAMFGAGAQAYYQVQAVNAVRPLTQVKVIDLDPVRAERLAASLKESLPDAAIRVEVDSAEALVDAEIVNCATTARSALFSIDRLPADVHVNAIGAFKPSMRELPNDLLAAATVYVDDRASVLAEAGDIIEAVGSGTVRAENLNPIGRSLRETFQRSPMTVFKSVGIAAQDWAIAHLVAARSG
jgi:ornithine cyclodeaminase